MPFVEIETKRLLFIHVPKTGGGAIEAWLKTLAPLHFHSIGVPLALRCTPQHLRMADFRALFGDGYCDAAVMIVRNPYDLIASEYRMRATLARQGFRKDAPRFSQWLETNLAAVARNPFHLDNHLRPQWDFHGSGVEVLRYEDGLVQAAARIAELLDVPKPEELPRVNDTSFAGINVVWDLSDRLRVQDFYAKDFEVFNY
jgi:hypothetical protein